MSYDYGKKKSLVSSIQSAMKGTDALKKDGWRVLDRTFIGKQIEDFEIRLKSKGFQTQIVPVTKFDGEDVALVAFKEKPPPEPPKPKREPDWDQVEIEDQKPTAPIDPNSGKTPSSHYGDVWFKRPVKSNHLLRSPAYSVDALNTATKYWSIGGSKPKDYLVGKNKIGISDPLVVSLLVPVANAEKIARLPLVSNFLLHRIVETYHETNDIMIASPLDALSALNKSDKKYLAFTKAPSGFILFYDMAYFKEALSTLSAFAGVRGSDYGIEINVPDPTAHPTMPNYPLALRNKNGDMVLIANSIDGDLHANAEWFTELVAPYRV